MPELLAIILAITIHLIPGKVTEFKLVTDFKGQEKLNLQVTKQADDGWKIQGKSLKDYTYYLDGTKARIKNGNKSYTEDLTKHMTIGATPFKIQHLTGGLDFMFNDKGKDGGSIKVRWKSKKK